MKKLSFILSLSLISILAFPQWKWQNPIPAGNPLYAVFFTDPAHGYAAGDAGTVLKTTDGGSTWTVHPVGKEVTCNSMFFPNDNTGFIAGRKQSGGGSILKTTDAGITWSTVVSDTVEGLYTIYFPGNTTGYSAGLGGSFLKTTDGGNTWSHRDLGSCADIISLWFTNDSTGYAAGYDNSDYTGILLKTVNGGTSWDTLLYLQNFTSLSSVCFTDDSTGYVGGSHTLLKTVDAGVTWLVDSTGLGQLYNIDAYGVFFTSRDTGYASDYMGNLFQTTDAGASWHYQSAFNDAGAALCFPNSNTGYAVTAESRFYDPYTSIKILKTENGGSSWNELSNGTNSGYCLYAVFFPDDSTGYAGGTSDTGSVLMKTTNGGKEWSASNLEYPANCASLFFTGKDNGYMAGYQGYIGKTTDGGSTWTKLTTGTNYLLYSLFFTNENTGYAAGMTLTSQSKGIILKTVNSGATWVPTHFDYKLFAVCFPDSLTGYCIGDSVEQNSVIHHPVILKTNDGGTTWNKVSYTTSTDKRISALFFTDASTGYIAGDIAYPEYAFISKTTDGGETWTDIPLPANSCYPRSMCFATPSKGYISDWCGNIFYSSDAGATWSDDSSNTWNDLYSIYFPDSVTGYAVGGLSTILAKKIDAVYSVQEKQPPVARVHLWPNPADSKITIRYESMGNPETNIAIYTMRGELLLRKEFDHQSQIEFDVGKLVKGVYLVKIQSKEGIEVKKMVID